MKKNMLLVMGVLLTFTGLAAKQSLELLEKKVVESPSDARALYELTRLYCEEDSAKAIDAWRKLADLDVDLASDVYLRTNVATYLGLEPFFPQLLSDSMVQGPRFSPDGKWIVFQAVLNGRMQIAMMDFFGNHYQVITDADYYHHSSSFVGSADEVMYMRETQEGGVELVYADLAGDETRVILSDFAYEVEYPNRPQEKLPILFSYLSPDSKTMEVGLYDTKSGKFKELTRNAYSDRNARYSSKGNLIVWGNDNHLNSELYIMNKRGKVKERITRSSANDILPDFGDHDGKIAFVSSRHDGQYDIFVYDRRSKDVIPITFNEAMDLRPDLSDDGNWLVFDSNRREGRVRAYVVPLNQPISGEQLVEEIDKGKD